MDGPSSGAAPDGRAHVDFAGISALSSRAAGYAVAQKCLEVQSKAEAADPSLNTDRRFVLHADAWSWYQGALGEIEVGRLLSELGPEWFVRHAVPIGAGTKDVDHLVIGPAGVFAINTKHHRGHSIWVGDRVLRVNGANTPHLSAARHDARDVSRRLEDSVGFIVPVAPVVAVLGARTPTDKRSPQNRTVAVMDASRLVSWLKARPPALSPTMVDLLMLAAEEPKTWHVDPRAADTFRVMQRFERLASRVGNPTAPIAADSRTPSRQRRVTRQPSAPRPSSSAVKPSAQTLVRWWAVAVVVVIGVLAIRAIADQPCGTPITCVVPPAYIAARPLLLLLAAVTVGRALIGTILRSMRTLTRH